MMSKEQAEKKAKQMREWANRAVALQDKVRAAHEKMKANPEAWKEFCELTGVSEDCGPDDWFA